MSQQQRALLEQKQEEMRDKRFGSRLNNQTFTLDFAGRKVIDEKKNIDFKNYAFDIDNILSEKPISIQVTNPVINQDIDSINLKFVEEKGKKSSAKKETGNEAKKFQIIVFKTRNFKR